MRTFDYMNLPKCLFDREAGDLGARLFEDRGRMRLLQKLRPADLAAAQEHALEENADASTRIEGIYVGTERSRELICADRAAGFARVPGETDSERQVVGYARALHSIYSFSDELDLSAGTVVKVYETLFCGRELGRGSRYRKRDYLYTQVDGHLQAVAASPVSAFETPLVLGAAVDSLAGAFDAERCSPLVLAAVFTVDFLCIRPFDEGNGRIARLFSELLLEKAGFEIGRYAPVCRLIEDSAADYYDALNACVEGWDRGRNDYTPYVVYWFDVLHRAYQGLFERMELDIDAGGSKAARIRLFLERAEGPVRKRDVLKANPDVSVSTVENVLGEMVREGALVKQGSGRATAYVRPTR